MTKYILRNVIRIQDTKMPLPDVFFISDSIGNAQPPVLRADIDSTGHAYVQSAAQQHNGITSHYTSVHVEMKRHGKPGNGISRRSAVYVIISFLTISVMTFHTVACWLARSTLIRLNVQYKCSLSTNNSHNNSAASKNG